MYDNFYSERETSVRALRYNIKGKSYYDGAFRNYSVIPLILYIQINTNLIL